MSEYDFTKSGYLDIIRKIEKGDLNLGHLYIKSCKDKLKDMQNPKHRLLLELILSSVNSALLTQNSTFRYGQLPPLGEQGSGWTKIKETKENSGLEQGLSKN